MAIWRQAFLGGTPAGAGTSLGLSLGGGTVDHHTLVYEYVDGRRLLSLKSAAQMRANEPQEGQPLSLHHR